MEKNIRNFEKFFNISVIKSKIRIDTKFFTYNDLYNHCYIVYHRSKKCDDPKTYKGYIVQRLTGAILDYLENVLRTKNKKRGKPSYLNNVSIENPIYVENKDSTKITIEDTLQSPDNTRIEEANLIVREVMENPTLLTHKQKEFFVRYYINDFTQKQIVQIMKVTSGRVCQISALIRSKLRNYYNKAQ